jgi:hypothetical protein
VSLKILATLPVMRGDTSRGIDEILKFRGAVLTGIAGSTCRIVFQNRDTGEVRKKVATSWNTGTAAARYDFSADDVRYRGFWYWQWEVTRADGKIITVPDGGYYMLEIQQDLG